MISTLIRESTPDDLNWILSAWRANILSSEVYKTIDKELVNYETQTIMRDILAHEKTKILVACDPEDPVFCFAFAVFGVNSYGVNVLHCIYTRKTSRKLGIARLLMEKTELSGVLYMSTQSMFHREVIEKIYGSRVLFNPFCLRSPL